jgi:hypothetical protein
MIIFLPIIVYSSLITDFALDIIYRELNQERRRNQYASPEINLEDFQKIDLRVGEILAVERLEVLINSWFFRLIWVMRKEPW